MAYVAPSPNGWQKISSICAFCVNPPMYQHTKLQHAPRVGTFGV